jgi:predicted ATPase
MNAFVVISGCSGGGKSALIAELARRGYPTMEEPGRRIVQEELAGTGTALPWVDPAAFARKAVAMALDDRLAAAGHDGLVFFDRGLVDAAAALQHATGDPAIAELGTRHRYHRTVFFTPPWRDLFRSDTERRHGFDAAVAEYYRLEAAYDCLGYDVVFIPKGRVRRRADFILEMLG